MQNASREELHNFWRESQPIHSEPQPIAFEPYVPKALCDRDLHGEKAEIREMILGDN